MSSSYQCSVLRIRSCICPMACLYHIAYSKPTHVTTLSDQHIRPTPTTIHAITLFRQQFMAFNATLLAVCFLRQSAHSAEFSVFFF